MVGLNIADTFNMVRSRIVPILLGGILSTSVATAEALQCLQLFSRGGYQGVKTQTELIEEGLREYFPNLIDNFKENLAHLTGMSDFDLFQIIHRSNPEGSPFRLFKKNSVKNKPQQEWSFPFYNSGKSFRDILNLEFGLCSGMTSTLRKFNMLATFDATASLAAPDKTTQPELWLKYYTDKIDQIIDYRMTTIDGFENLYSFASDPEIQKYIRLNVLQKWKENNVNILQGSVDGFLSVNQTMTVKDLIELRRELSQRLEYGYNPIVYLSQPATKFFSKEQWIHVVMVTGVSNLSKDGSFMIEIWDSNHKAEAAQRLIQISAFGEIKLEDINLNMIKMLRWDDLEIERMIKANLPK